MKQIVLSAEAAAAATTRQPWPGDPDSVCWRCGGTEDVPQPPGEPLCDDCWTIVTATHDHRSLAPMRLRFVPVDDTYTEGEHIQIVAGGEQVDESGRVVSSQVGRSLDVRNGCPPATPSRVVATATVAQVLPIEDDYTNIIASHIAAYDDGEVELWEWHDPPIDGEVWWTSRPLSDHLPFVAFTPGGTAIELTDVEPT